MEFKNEEMTKNYGKKIEQSRNVTGYDYFELKKGIRRPLIDPQQSNSNTG